MSSKDKIIIYKKVLKEKMKMQMYTKENRHKL